MTTTTRNEAAERMTADEFETFVRNARAHLGFPDPLAAERRATVERIRAAVLADPSDSGDDWVYVKQVTDILDEEAAR